MQVRSQDEIVLDLHSLAAEDGYIHTISFLLHTDLYWDSATDPTKVNPLEHLSIDELAYLIGLLFAKRPTFTEADPSAFQDQLDRSRGLMMELHTAFEKPIRESIESALIAEPPDSNPFGHGKVLREPMFYGAASGYDFQMATMATEKYKYDTEWLRQHKNADLAVYQSIHSTLRKLHQTKMRELQLEFDKTKKAPTTLLPTFCFNRETLCEWDENVIDSFLNNFSAMPEEFKRDQLQPGEYNILYSRPIVKTDSNSFFLPICNLLARSLYETPFYWMITDPDYGDRAAQNRGLFVEEMAHSLLCRPFGDQNTLCAITVHKSKEEEATDIDVLAICGNRALIVQAKSKRLTELSRLGNDDQIKNDFEKAIQSAYDQGIIARTAILSPGSILTNKTGERISLNEDIKEAYIICVLSDDYPALLLQTDCFLKKPASNSPSPLALNLLDLDVLVHYLEDPYDFLFYVHQRTSLAANIMAVHELDLLGFHLNQKLFIQDNGEVLFVGGSFGKLIDASTVT